MLQYATGSVFGANVEKARRQAEAEAEEERVSVPNPMLACKKVVRAMYRMCKMCQMDMFSKGTGMRQHPT